MKKILFLIYLFFIAVAINAQDNSFLIYSVKGNVSVVENKIESKAKIGKIITGNTSLKLADGSVATLICNEAAMFTIKKAGSYTLSQFKDSCETHSSSVSANYVKYVWNQMTAGHEGSPGSNRKAFMSTVGAVSRSVNNIWIDPRLDTINYSNGDFPLSWKSYADAKDFEFSLYTSPDGGTPLYKNTLSKMKISIPSFASRLKPGNTYYWTSAVKGETNDEIKVLNYVEKPVYEMVLNKLKAEGPAYESDAEQAYRTAFGLEDARYLSEAYQYYLRAATLKPDMPLYRSTLMSFKKDYEIK
ncbi:MAG TPA: hypothetical protein VKC90_02845 [Chitinophagaceae bacterium]|nr:hypothetical protein [Chitinophagaceae bacterium]